VRADDLAARLRPSDFSSLCDITSATAASVRLLFLKAFRSTALRSGLSRRVAFVGVLDARESLARAAIKSIEAARAVVK
jgi:hypothetical protein